MKRLHAVTIMTALCLLTGFRSAPGPARFMELGDKALAERRPAEALEFYSKGIGMAPDKPDYYLSRAFLFLKLKRAEEALRDLDRYIALAPESAQGYMSRGMLYSDLGRKQEADADFTRACRLGEQGGCSFAGEENKPDTGSWKIPE